METMEKRVIGRRPVNRSSICIYFLTTMCEIGPRITDVHFDMLMVEYWRVVYLLSGEWVAWRCIWSLEIRSVLSPSCQVLLVCFFFNLGFSICQ